MKQPFFIVGTGRTGSSYLLVLLNAHPKVALTNEGNMFAFLQRAHRLSKTPVAEMGMSGRGIIVGEYIPLFSTIFVNQAKDAIEAFYRSFFSRKAFTLILRKMKWLKKQY